ncbi:uncharacterized protein LOC134775329 [Penaeus indicus]|uniref:uncharacterized protein LOC134775329 n=1 Tax=Penaeus indicus TaxID=29960 RepID=UPI00300CC92B
MRRFQSTRILASEQSDVVELLPQKMRLVVSVFWMVAGTAWALEENSVDNLYDEHFPPLRPNCTQSLTDVLLLRQEVLLKELKQAEQVSAGILRELADILTDNKVSSTSRVVVKATTVWVGGRDHLVEGEWRWVSGEDMPRGTPFWGHTRK